MKPVAFALFAAVLVASCGEAPAPAPAANKAAGPLATGTAELREVELSLSAEAVVEAVRQSTVSAQVSGRASSRLASLVCSSVSMEEAHTPTPSGRRSSRSWPRATEAWNFLPWRTSPSKVPATASPARSAGFTT